MLVSILSSINCYQGEKVEHGPKYSEPVWSKVQFEGDHEDITNIIYYIHIHMYVVMIKSMPNIMFQNMAMCSGTGLEGCHPL